MATPDDTTALLDALDAAIVKARGKAKRLPDLDAGQAAALGAIGRAKPAIRDVAARTILERHDKYTDIAITYAWHVLRKTIAKDPALARVAARAIMNMNDYQLVKTLVGRARRGAAEAIALLWLLFVFDERQTNEYHAQYVKEFAIGGLGVRLLEPARFTTWLALLGRKGFERLTGLTYQQALSPYERASLLGKLRPAQRHELVISMSATRPISRHSDPPKAIVQALYSPALHTKVLATLARDRKRTKRYTDMVDDDE